jgi:molecular chaperone GrpE
MSDEPQKDEQAAQNPQADELKAKVEEAVKKDEEKKEADGKKDEAQSKIDELTSSLMRCMADMQNFKRRTEEDKSKWIRFANYELLSMLIPIIDNFDRGCQQLPDGLKDDNWAKGVVHTHDDLMKALEKFGVRKMVTIGQKLDPARHEAVIAGPGKKDEIIEELEPGYTYHDQTLKPAKVKVGDGS